MKNFYFMVLLIFLLVGCSTDGTSDSSKTEKEEPIQGELAKDAPPPRKTMNDYLPNPQVTDDRTLLNVGDTFRDEKGYAKLKEYKKLNKKISAGSIELVLKEAKLIEYQPAYSLIDFFHGYTDEEQFTFLKVFVEVENKSDEILNFAPVAHIQTDTGEAKNWKEDIYLEELNGAIRPGEKKAGNIGVIVENTDITSIKIMTSKVFNQSDSEIFKEQATDIQF